MSRLEVWTEQEANLRAEGYECQHCGYTPTWLELDRGFCPKCPGKKSKKVPTLPSEK